MKLKELIAPNGSSVICGNSAVLDREATGISHDSREVLAGMVFAAIRGSRADGGSFIKDAVAKGAVCVITEEAPADDLPENVVCVVTDDVKKALARLSARFYGEPSKNLKLAGVTGTNGKTTVGYLVESIFKTSGMLSGLIGTVSYRYGSVTLPSPFTTPQAPQLQRLLKEMEVSGVTHCVMEVSSHSLSEKRVDFIKFDAKVFTNLTPEHLDYHLTMEDYYRAKARFFTSPDFKSGTGVINIDDKWGWELKKEAPGSLCYSLKTGADIHPGEYRLMPDGIRAELKTPAGPVSIDSQLVGEYNLYNIMAAAGAASVLGFKPGEIEKGINGLKSVPGRLERFRNANGTCAYVDYAHTPDALERALNVLNSIHNWKRIITVFGCGGNRDRKKRPVMGEIATRLSHVTIITSDNPRDEDPLEIIKEIEAGIGNVRRYGAEEDIGGAKGYMVMPDRGEALVKAVDMAGKDDVIFAAGKGHEDYQIIGSGRINFDERKLIGNLLKAVEHF